MDKSVYTVGWLCALPIEMTVAVGMLDERYSGPPLEQDDRDHNIYKLGKVGPHHVVIACLPAGVYGVASAAVVAGQMRWTFPSLRFGLMVGIGGGVPSDEHDIRLGDVVVSQPTGSFGGVIQYDFGKTVQRGRFQRTGSLNKPPKILLGAVSVVKVQHDIDEPQFLSHLAEMAVKHPRLSQKTVSPGIEKDHLFKANYNHSAREATCEHCRTDCLVIRGPPGGRRPLDGRPFIHYGLIASGDQVMKDGVTRERLRKELGVLCFEMEAAGLMDDFPCLVIRGICDYADSHKHKEWQSYAAAMAAAYAKELLLVIPPSAVAKEAKISTLVTGMNSKVDELLIAVRSQKSMQLMDRLSSVNFWDKQHDIYSRAQPGTSTWFLGDPTFKSWLAAQDGVLWCRGLPGTGKTVLASIVINHLLTTFENENVGLAWIYLDYSEHDSQTVEISFASLLRQLIQKDGIVSESMITSIGVSWREGKPNRTAYKSMLQRALQQYSKTIIVIDALDELRDPFLRKDLISELRRLTPAVNLLITSQPLRDIHDILDDTPQIEILPRNEDVKKSLECELQNSENLRKLDPSLQQTITTRLMQSNDGTFLKAVLNLRSLAQKGTAQEMTKFLEILPDSYAGIYIFYMKEIEAQDHAPRTRAFQVLSWLSHALGSLTIDAIKHALSVRTGDREFHDDAQPDADNLVSVCCNFVIIDQKTKTIRLVHGTAEEYLKTIRSSIFPASHSIISSTCLTYLSLSQFTGLCLSQGDVERRSLLYPFYRYAAENWSKHVALDNLESSLQDSIIEFLESRQRYGADEAMARHRRSAWGADGGTPWTDWNRMSIQRRDLPLHAAATYGLRKTVAFLLKERGYRVDQLNNFGETALHRAAQVGQASTMDELIVNGADVNAKVLHHYLGQATAMILASSCLQMDAVRVLLNRGVDVNASDPQNRLTPLHFAASMSTDLARFVLEYGADPNLTALRPPIFPERGPMTSLHLCVYLAHAYDGAIDRARLLLDSGAHINKQTGLGSTALHLAIAGGHQGLVRILLDREANVYLTNGEGKSPIQLAQELGYFSWVKDWIQPSILEEILHNAPALIQAIWATDIERVRNLLDQDIDITEKDQNGKSPWDYCVLSANIQIANMLADHMDSKSLPDYIGSDAFETALPRMTAFDYSDNTTWERTLQICQRLVGYRMAFNGNLDFARGRSPVGNYNKTCLIWAAELGRLAEVEFLLECGSDVNAQDMFGSTAAGYAIANNNEAIAKILIDHGADLSIKDRFGRTPLQTADGSSIPSMRASLEAALAKRDAKSSENEEEHQAVVHAGYSAGASHDTEFR